MSQRRSLEYPDLRMLTFPPSYLHKVSQSILFLVMTSFLWAVLLFCGTSPLSHLVLPREESCDIWEEDDKWCHVTVDQPCCNQRNVTLPPVWSFCVRASPGPDKHFWCRLVTSPGTGDVFLTLSETFLGQECVCPVGPPAWLRAQCC